MSLNSQSPTREDWSPQNLEIPTNSLDSDEVGISEYGLSLNSQSPTREDWSPQNLESLMSEYKPKHN